MKIWGDKRYLLFCGLAAGIILALIAALNYVVDPYNLLGNNRTGIYFVLERQVKDDILTYRHEGVLLGSSKTGYINPDELFCYRFYNASMRGMVPEEIYFYLKKYLRNEKLVLIGFDFYMFNERELPLVRINNWNDLRYTKVEYLLGAQTLKDSWKTLKMRFNNEKRYGMKPNGQFDYPGLSLETASVGPEQYKQKYNTIIRGLVENYYDHFSFSEKRMDYVRQIKALLEERGAPYAIFINPLNTDVLAALQNIEAYSRFLSWRREMKEIFPDLYDFSEGPYSKREGFYLEDPYHYTQATGRAFLNEIIGDFCIGKSQP